MKYGIQKTLRQARLMHSLESIRNEFISDNKSVLSPSTRSLITQFISSKPSSKVAAPNIEEYINQRLEKLTRQDDSTRRIISATLTFPLSVASCLNQLFPAEDFLDKTNISIIGARSESSLPPIFWNELLYSVTSPNVHINVEFFGPELQIKGLSSAWEREYHWNQNQLKLFSQPQNKQTFHNLKNKEDILLQSSVFCLFHPGFGSRSHSAEWKPTLSLLLDTRKPIFCTAFSELDLETDLNFLRAAFQEEDNQELGDSMEMLIAPSRNPFASLRKEVRNDEIVITNQYYYCFRLK